MNNLQRDKLATKVASAFRNLSGKRNASDRLVQGIYSMVNPSQKDKSLREASKIGNRLLERNSKHVHKPLMRRKRVGFMVIGLDKPSKSAISIEVASNDLPKIERPRPTYTGMQNYKIVVRDPDTLASWKASDKGTMKGRFLNGSNR